MVRITPPIHAAMARAIRRYVFQNRVRRARTAGKEDAVLLRVGGMKKIEAPEKRIGRKWGGAEQIAPAVGLGLADPEHFFHPPLGIAPDPAVNRLQQAVH